MLAVIFVFIDADTYDKDSEKYQEPDGYDLMAVISVLPLACLMIYAFVRAAPYMFAGH